MGKFCVMRTCTNAHNITSSIKRHEFPSSVELRSKWDQFVIEGNRNNQFKSQASDDIWLCERHFDPSCYYTSGKLRSDAIPTIADKFTSEIALKFNLIPSLESDLLVNVNEFSKSIIKRARTPEPGGNIEPSSSLTPMEVEDDLVPENIFSNGMLELMVIDLGEESDDDTDSVDNAITGPSLKQEKSDNSDSDFACPSFSDHDTSSSSAHPVSPVTSRLRPRKSMGTQAKVDKVDTPSSSIQSSKPAPIKKSTPVNTSSRLGTSPSPSPPRLRTRSSIQPTVEKGNPSSTPVKSFKRQPAKTKFQPAKTKPQPAKTIPAVNTVSEERPSGRLRSRTSTQGKIDKDDQLPTPVISISEDQENGVSISESPSPSRRSRLRARTSLQPGADKVDSLLTTHKSPERRRKDSTSSTTESLSTRLRSRPSIKPKIDEVENVEQVKESSTPLTGEERESLARSKPEGKSLLRSNLLNQVSSSENKTLPENIPLPPENEVSSDNGQPPQHEAKLSESGNNLFSFELNVAQPEDVFLANGNCVTSPVSVLTPSFRNCSCTIEEHSKVKGIARLPKEAGIEFTKRSEELTSVRRELRNIRHRYECAMMKIEMLTLVLNRLKEKRRQKGHRDSTLDCCLHCKKVLN